MVNRIFIVFLLIVLRSLAGTSPSTETVGIELQGKSLPRFGPTQICNSAAALASGGSLTFGEHAFNFTIGSFYQEVSLMLDGLNDVRKLISD